MLILGKKTFGLLIVGMALSSCGFTFSRSSSSLGSASSASTGLSLSTGSSASTGSSSSGSSSSSISTSQPDDAALVNSPEYLAFWNCESDLRMSLTFTARALADISYYGARENDSTFFDVYFPAAFSLSLNGTTYNYEEVGVRMKGNTSRKAFCDSDGTITRTAHFKVSFKATFSDESYDLDDEVKTYKKDWTGDPSGLALRKNRTLFGMEKIDLKYVPRNFDPYCVSQEVYVYDSFRKEGIMAPRANLAAMEITDVVSSLSYVVEAVECIDKVFLKRYYNKAESKGDLYKCVYGPKGPADLSRDGTVERVEDANGNNVGARIASGRIGVEDNINGYHPSYDLSTNDDEGNSGTFSSMGILGYELDINDINGLESEEIKKQIALYKANREVFQYGEYDQLESIYEGPFSTKEVHNGSKAFVSKTLGVQSPHPSSQSLRVEGLEPKALYSYGVRGEAIDLKKFGAMINYVSPVHIKEDGGLIALISRHKEMPIEKVFGMVSGSALAVGAVRLPPLWNGTGYGKEVAFLGDFGSRLYIVEKIKK